MRYTLYDGLAKAKHFKYLGTICTVDWQGLNVMKY